MTDTGTPLGMDGTAASLTQGRASDQATARIIMFEPIGNVRAPWPVDGGKGGRGWSRVSGQDRPWCIRDARPRQAVVVLVIVDPLGSGEIGVM